MASERVSGEHIDLALSQLSRRLKALRNERGFRLSDLANLTGFSEAYLYRVEEGDRSPSLPALIRLGEVYGVSASSLLEEDRSERRSAHHEGTAVWVGPESTGSGTMYGPSAKVTVYDVASRLGEGDRRSSSPEEHIGMAIAGYFAMSLAQKLEVAGFRPVRIETTAHVALTYVSERLEIGRIELNAEADVADIDDARLEEIAQSTRKTCVVARALAAVPVTLTLTRPPAKDAIASAGKGATVAAP